MVFPVRNSDICTVTYLSLLTRIAVDVRNGYHDVDCQLYLQLDGDRAPKACETTDYFRPTLSGCIISYFWEMALTTRSPDTLYAQIIFSGDI